MATPSARESPHRVRVLRELEEAGIDPAVERETVCLTLRDQGYDDFADYLGRLPERTYQAVVSETLE